MQGHGVIIADIDKSHNPGHTTGHHQGQTGGQPSGSGSSGTLDSGSIGNSLQLLTQGHPSLLLNYCK